MRHRTGAFNAGASILLLWPISLPILCLYYLAKWLVELSTAKKRRQRGCSRR